MDRFTSVVDYDREEARSAARDDLGYDDIPDVDPEDVAPRARCRERREHNGVVDYCGELKGHTGQHTPSPWLRRTVEQDEKARAGVWTDEPPF